MTTKSSATIDAAAAKRAAHEIKERLGKLDVPIKLNHAYEALASAHRFPNWATMKAALGDLNAEAGAVVRAGPAFRLGTENVAPGEGDRPWVEVSLAEANGLFHVFGTSASARRELLMLMASQTVEAGAGVVFFDDILDPEARSGTISRFMRLLGKASRGNQFRIVDVSTAGSRLGNSCNILHGAEDADIVASALVPTDHPLSADMLVLCRVAVSRAIAAAGRGERSSLTVGAILDEVMGMEKGHRPLLEEDGVSAHVVKCFDELRRAINGTQADYPNMLDQESGWDGPRAVLGNGEVLLVLANWRDRGQGGHFARLVLDSVRRSVVLTFPRPVFPHLVAFNDIQAIAGDQDLVDRAVRSRVTMAVADQCPSPPRTFRGGWTGTRVERDGIYTYGFLRSADGRERPFRVGW